MTGTRQFAVASSSGRTGRILNCARTCPRPWTRRSGRRRGGVALVIDQEMPGWATRLASVVPGYRFSTVRFWDRCSVAAERVGGTTGPVVVITSDETQIPAPPGLAHHSAPAKP